MATSINAPYNAYNNRDIPDDDGELTRVGPGTPCGEYFRRFWLPVALSEELKDLPLRIRILGEDLVAFREKAGNVGVLQLYCSHRGTSLEYGHIEDRGIRCCYHAWLFDVDGKILDTPGEPADSPLKHRIHHGAYPTHEYKGLVFAYMGPPDKKPVFPRFDTCEMPGYQCKVVPKYINEANWLQLKENSMDPAHLDFLHAREGSIGFTQHFRLRAELDFLETPLGMIYTATRRVGDNVWVRISDFIPPCFHQYPADHLGARDARYGPPEYSRFTVPIDDHNTLLFNLKHVLEGSKEETVDAMIGFGQTGNRPYEARQRVPGDYDAQVSIHGGLARPALEHLGTVDRGVVMLRAMIRKGVRAAQSGHNLKGMVVSKEGGVLRTYGGDTVLRAPPAATPETDKALLHQTAKKVTDRYFNNAASERSKEGGALVAEIV